MGINGGPMRTHGGPWESHVDPTGSHGSPWLWDPMGNHVNPWGTHCPLGPAIVTDIDPHVLNLTTQVNGEVRQDTNTNDLIFDCFDIIEYLTTAFTLEPGDVIVTGSWCADKELPFATRVMS